MPAPEVPKSKRQKAKVKEFKRALYHSVLYDVLRCVRQAQKAGGFFARHQTRCVLEIVTNVVCD